MSKPVKPVRQSKLAKQAREARQKRILYDSIYIEIIGNSVYSDTRQIVGFHVHVLGWVGGQEGEITKRHEGAFRSVFIILNV